MHNQPGKVKTRPLPPDEEGIRASQKAYNGER